MWVPLSSLLIVSVPSAHCQSALAEPSGRNTARMCDPCHAVSPLSAPSLGADVVQQWRWKEVFELKSLPKAGLHEEVVWDMCSGLGAPMAACGKCTGI